MTHNSSDLARLRELMQIEIEASIRYGKEKAIRYLGLVRAGTKTTEAWQILNADDELLEYEREMEEAKADRLVAWLEANRASFGDDVTALDPADTDV